MIYREWWFSAENMCCISLKFSNRSQLSILETLRLKSFLLNTRCWSWFHVFGSDDFPQQQMPVWQSLTISKNGWYFFPRIRKSQMWSRKDIHWNIYQYFAPLKFKRKTQLPRILKECMFNIFSLLTFFSLFESSIIQIFCWTMIGMIVICNKTKCHFLVCVSLCTFLFLSLSPFVCFFVEMCGNKYVE